MKTPSITKLLLAGLCLATAMPSYAESSFSSWPAGSSPREVGLRVSERFLSKDYRLSGREKRFFHYAETCTWYGALEFAQLTDNQALRSRLVARFEPIFGPRASLIPPVTNVDWAVFGALPLELYQRTKDPRFLQLGRRIADEQWAAPVAGTELSPEAREGLAAGLTWHTRFWIDDMYMITMLQTQAYRATGEWVYVDRAAREAVAYLDKLQQPNGLFFHAPDSQFFWGRGNGWFAAGMSELLRSLPTDHPLRPRILAGYQKMMATLLKFQGEDGMWRQLIDDPQSWPETSGTGMFTFAFITGVQHGWLDEKTYAGAARKGWLALVQRINAEGDITDVCEGTNKGLDRPYYLARLRLTGDLHGQAPILWCAGALLR
ncbi:glycoside hydrolase family 88 protein [Opitutus sp. ER46]|uniref:glycoside hydrolase family 88/105 protein n=1 Tax=Opitutus sp. ER46 TaxID=2161864 RepID=UPI000D30FE7B|nr:glycoside hydrolase family 88 protein [Opitutus sp. ER46]PTX94621.1 glycosyl hydrolase [Opitutus sp. ER46]